MGGFDSTAEEIYGWVGRAAPSYGWNCLIFEGPGQWGALYDNPGLHFRPDYDAPLHAVVDWAEKRPETQKGQLALIGYSLGGCLAPRAVAFELRIGAVIANSLVVDVGEAFRAAWPSYLRAAPPFLFNMVFGVLAAFSVSARWRIQHGRWAMGIKEPYDFLMAWRDYSLLGLEDRIRCPLLCLFGRNRPDERATDPFNVALHQEGPCQAPHPSVHAGRRSSPALSDERPRSGAGCHLRLARCDLRPPISPAAAR